MINIENFDQAVWIQVDNVNLLTAWCLLLFKIFRRDQHNIILHIMASSLSNIVKLLPEDVPGAVLPAVPELYLFATPEMVRMSWPEEK